MISGRVYEISTSVGPLATLNLGHMKQAKRRGDEEKLQEEEDHLPTQQIEVVGMSWYDRA